MAARHQARSSSESSNAPVFFAKRTVRAVGNAIAGIGDGGGGAGGGPKRIGSGGGDANLGADRASTWC